jgi:hypothetical protein
MTVRDCIAKSPFLRVERRQDLYAITDSGIKKLIVPSPFRPRSSFSDFLYRVAMGARVRRNLLRPVAFSLCLSIGLALFEQQFWTPNRTEIVLPGVRWAKFEGLLHEQPPTWRLKGGRENT